MSVQPRVRSLPLIARMPAVGRRAPARCPLAISWRPLRVRASRGVSRQADDAWRLEGRKSMITKRAIVLAIAAFGFAVNDAKPATAQAYPSRPITIIVPFAAGGTTDVIARILGEHMSRTLGQQLIVENVVGAGGTTGSTRAMRANPDGYTIELGNMG